MSKAASPGTASQKQQHQINGKPYKTAGKFDPEFRERRIKADFTGCLAAADAFMAGNLKGIGKIYMQAVVGCHSRFAFGHLYTSKVPVTAVHVLNDKVLPFFEENNCLVMRILTDNGRGYCGRPYHHPFELFLQLEEIKRRTTPVKASKRRNCRAPSQNSS